MIASYERNREKEMSFFGQEHFLCARAKGGLDSNESLDALALNHRLSRDEGIDKVMLAAPSNGPAWLTGFIKGDNRDGGFLQPAAVVGCLYVTVPAGYLTGLPIGISFVGRAW